MKGCTLSVGYIPMQWMLATGEGDREGWNITYITTTEMRRGRNSSLVGPKCSLCKTRFPARTDNIRKLLDSESGKGGFECTVLTTLHAHNLVDVLLI